MLESNQEQPVTYRGRANRLEVDTPTAMIEFNITPKGLEPGSMFANSGHGLEEVTIMHREIARRQAREWLQKAKKNNSNF